jgi:hypothetical protein
MAEASAAFAAFMTAKRASTAALSALVNAHNGWVDRTRMTQAINAYVVAFNAMTSASNETLAKMKTMDEQRATWLVSLQNLSDEQVEEMKKEPQTYYCAGYLAVVNSLLFFPKERALEVIDLMRNDLVQDVTNAWNDYASGVTPDVPRTAVVYESGHALDFVKKALADATPPDDPAAS